ncbi:YbaB/EbfC family nucleoid-associated protein [Nonomuraea sp. NN258]|uniref:YbaB/EbfC family nucleoid-associated protein n=1 Tax=Nonomuraea antri TaxID=2730852 RepID=UPI0015691EC7|nr:YbaB/EbfC family nucleoid-associated protein [Nonomuraea antri]NRQ39451.1 YbaB/EbfC family nucleoid-associated protein [Nonomuraea antri]
MYGPRDIREPASDEPVRQAEMILAWTETAQNDLSKVIGTGHGPSGLVRAAVDPDGQVLDVAVEAAALELTPAELAGEVMIAVRQAQRDAEQQIRELMCRAMPGFDLAEARAQLSLLLSAD